VLLIGESGTGKEGAARAIYSANPRGSFVPIDCGSLVGTLVESELFGHAKGSFSGAIEQKRGLLELADGGTVFLDEIGELPLSSQVRLLRVLQEGELRAVGALRSRTVNVRVIAATNSHDPSTGSSLESRRRFPNTNKCPAKGSSSMVCVTSACRPSKLLRMSQAMRHRYTRTLAGR